MKNRLYNFFAAMRAIKFGNFFNHFFVAIGACASLLTMISFFFKIEWTNHPCRTWFFIVMIFVVCSGYAFLQVWRKTKIVIKIKEHLKLTIAQKNLWDQEGIIVVPINNYFDTYIGYNDFDERTVPGQFIMKYFKDDKVKDLNEQITTGLTDINGEEDNNRVNGRNIKYPLGTCVKVTVPDDKNCYVLFVSTEYNEKNKPDLAQKDLTTVLSGLFNYLESFSDNRIIHMPLIGAGLTRLSRTRERILLYIIDYIDFSLSDNEFDRNIQINIRSLKDINLNRIEDIFKDKQE